MTQTVQLKRSSVAGKVPTTSDLALGEMAINTYDGKVYIKKDNGTPSVVEVGASSATNLSTTANSSAVVVASDTGTDATIAAANATTAGVLSANDQTISGVKTFKNNVLLDNGGGDEGGELRLAAAATNTSLNGPIAIDIYQNRIRFFETGGSNRGAYIDLTSAATLAGSNLLTGGSSNSTPTNLSSSANSSTVSIFSDTGTDVTLVAANSTTAGILTAVAQTIAGDKTFTNIVSADYFNSTNNGNGTNYKVGDDAWIGDVNVSNALRIAGQQDPSQAYLILGNGDNTALSRTGTGRLKYGGSDVILASDTDSLATASKIVIRDGLGNFAANTITATLYGNANTATTLQTARTINGTSFNGSANITITANTPNSVTFSSSGLGGASGTTFDGGAAVTISYNTIGASPLAGSSSLTTTGVVTSGTWSASFGAVSGANLTNLTAGNLTGTIPSTVIGNSVSTLTIGTGLSGTSYNGTAGVTIAIDSTVATLSGTQTLTNKILQSRVATIASATSITMNGDTTDIAIMNNTEATGTFTINAPTGTPFDGQKLMLRLKSTNVQTFSWNAIFVGSTDAALPTASTGSSATDYMGFVYNSTAAKWQLVAKNFGF